MTGPRASEGAYDATIQALTGWMSLTGGPDEPPTKSGLSLADFIGGYVAALALVAGVWRARREGVGGDADLSLFESGAGAAQLHGGVVGDRRLAARAACRSPGTRRSSRSRPSRPRTGSSPSHAPRNRLWKRYCAAIGRPDLAGRSPVCGLRFARPSSGCAVADPPRGHGKPRTVAAWSEAFRAAGVPFAPVNDLDAALADEQAVARGVGHRL